MFLPIVGTLLVRNYSFNYESKKHKNRKTEVYFFPLLTSLLLLLLPVAIVLVAVAEDPLVSPPDAVEHDLAVAVALGAPF